MDSKPFDYKKLDALLAAARDLTGCPATFITLQWEEDGCQMSWWWSSVLGTTGALDPVEALVWQVDASPLKPDTEPNKNS